MCDLEEYAFVDLLGTIGCGSKERIVRRGHSIFVPRPGSRRGRQWRVDAAAFDRGEAQFRGHYMIECWSERAERQMREDAETGGID